MENTAPGAPENDPFTFLSVLDGKTYPLPPFDEALISDEFAKHPNFITEVNVVDALLADDPEVGMKMLNEPIARFHILQKRFIVKTLRNHLPKGGPSWEALSALINATEWDALGKVFAAWREHSGATGENDLGED